MDQGDLEGLRKERLIEPVLWLQRIERTSRASSKPTSACVVLPAVWNAGRRFHAGGGSRQ
jgi:hypothetical protein